MKIPGAAALSAILWLNGSTLSFAQAQNLQKSLQRPTLGISQSVNDPQLSLCADVVYNSLLVSQATTAFDFLPNWYMAQSAGRLDAEDPELWQKTYERLPRLQELIVLRVAPDYKYISAVWLHKQERSFDIYKAETVAIEQFSEAAQLRESCFLLSQKLWGNAEPERFRSPFLSAGLSLMIPGSGHFYRNTPEGLGWGSFFLLSYLGMSFLALSETTPLAQTQWGGIILSMTLIDALSAYFFTASEES